MYCIYRSLSGRKINLWYEDGRDGTIQAHLGPGQETTTNTYVGHEFYATYGGSDDEEITRFAINEDQVDLNCIYGNDCVRELKTNHEQRKISVVVRSCM